MWSVFAVSTASLPEQRRHSLHIIWHVTSIPRCGAPNLGRLIGVLEFCTKRLGAGDVLRGPRSRHAACGNAQAGNLLCCYSLAVDLERTRRRRSRVRRRCGVRRRRNRIGSLCNSLGSPRAYGGARILRVPSTARSRTCRLRAALIATLQEQLTTSQREIASCIISWTLLCQRASLERSRKRSIPVSLQLAFSAVVE